MKKWEKYWILGLIVLVVVVLVVVIPKDEKQEENGESKKENVEEFVQVLEDGTKLNTSSKLKEIKMLGKLQIGNIQLTNKNGQSVLLADVTNAGSTEIKVTLIDIELYDEDGRKIATIPGIISPLKAGEKTQLNTSVQQDYANAYDFKIVQK